MKIDEILFTLATFLFAVCTAPQFREVWKNRHHLKGYSLTGSFLTFLALICFTLAYIPLRYWTSMLFNVPGLVLWATVTYYTWKNRRRLT